MTFNLVIENQPIASKMVKHLKFSDANGDWKWIYFGQSCILKVWKHLEVSIKKITSYQTNNNWFLLTNSKMYTGLSLVIYIVWRHFFNRLCRLLLSVGVSWLYSTLHYKLTRYARGSFSQNDYRCLLNRIPTSCKFPCLQSTAVAGKARLYFVKLRQNYASLPF